MATYIGGSTLTSTAFTATGGTLGLNGNLQVTGNLKISGQPAFNASGTTGWLYSPSFSGPGWVEIGANMGWTSTQQGAGSYGFSNTTGRYTAPVAGKYFFHSSTYYRNDANTIANYIHFLFGKNGNPSWNVSGTPYNIYGHGEQALYSDGINVSAIIDMSVGDYVSVRPYWAGTQGRMYSSYTLFCGYLVM
jgi:hypothetical protein